MNKTVTPGYLHGELRVLPSKSASHRAVMMAALARGKTLLEPMQLSKDIGATLACAQALGLTRGAAMAAGVLTDFRLWNLDGAQTKGLHDRNDEILAHLHAAFSEPWQRNTWGWRLAKGVFVSFGERFDWPDAQAADRGALGRCRALSDQLAVLSDGTVVPCCLDHEGTLALGNLLCQDLPEILSAPLARTIREGFEKGIRAAPLCRRCGYAERFS